MLSFTVSFLLKSNSLKPLHTIVLTIEQTGARDPLCVSQNAIKLPVDAHHQWLAVFIGSQGHCFSCFFVSLCLDTCPSILNGGQEFFFAQGKLITS